MQSNEENLSLARVRKSLNFAMQRNFFQDKNRT
jgi:hypothetical protein